MTNALFFWCLLPETAHRPLEEMRYLFEEAPLFVSFIDNSKFVAGQDLNRRVIEVEQKQEDATFTHHV